MTPTPRTDANESITCKEGDPCIAPDFARQLERDISELSFRLIDRQQTLMLQAVKIQNAIRLLTRCRDSAGRMEIGLYEDIQNFLHTQP
jgi:hypothetical protein